MWYTVARYNSICTYISFCTMYAFIIITRGQRHLAKAAPNNPVHTARSVHRTRRRWFKPRDRQTDWLTDTANIGNNSQHLMHSMQPDNNEVGRPKSLVATWFRLLIIIIMFFIPGASPVTGCAHSKIARERAYYCILCAGTRWLVCRFYLSRSTEWPVTKIWLARSESP